MKKLIKIIAATALLLGSTAGCSQPSKSVGGDNTPKDCFSDTGSDKPMFVDMIWRGDDPPWEAVGTAVDVATRQQVDIHEIVAQESSLTKKLLYISGCKIEVSMVVKNHKKGFAFVRADDGPGGASADIPKGCRAQSDYVETIYCKFTTSR